jgi:hypothetical protein
MRMIFSRVLHLNPKFLEGAAKKGAEAMKTARAQDADDENDTKIKQDR